MTARLEIINIDEIPPEGKTVSFELNTQEFNQRLCIDKGLIGKPTVLKEAPKATIKAEVSGITVLLKGEASLLAEAVCSRCGEPTEIKLDPKISMVLKPRGRSQEEEEDLNLGFYNGKEIDLAPIVEEQLILGLPFKVLCNEDCLGLCPKCGENLNFNGKCECPPEQRVVEDKPGKFLPFADLKSKLKS